MKVSFINNKLNLNANTICSFDYAIDDILIFDSCIIILFNRDEFAKKNLTRSRNVVCVDFYGKSLWQIPELESDMRNCSYVGIERLNKHAKLIKFDGTFAVVDPENGVVLLSPLDSMKGRNLW